MEANRDWKVPAALILAGLALLVAFSGRNGLPFTGAGQDQPGQTIVIQNSQPSVAPGGSGSTVPSQAVPVPNPPSTQPSAPNVTASPHFGWGYGPDHGFGPGLLLFRFVALALLLFLVLRFFGWRRRWGWGHPGGYGPGPWRGQPMPPTPPMPPTQSAQGPQPGQGPGHWEWRADTAPPPARPNQAENNGDIMRPGEGSQE